MIVKNTFLMPSPQDEAIDATILHRKIAPVLRRSTMITRSVNSHLYNVLSYLVTFYPRGISAFPKTSQSPQLFNQNPRAIE